MERKIFVKIIRYKDRIWEYQMTVRQSKDDLFMLDSFNLLYEKNTFGKNKERTLTLVRNDMIDIFCKKSKLLKKYDVACLSEKTLKIWSDLFNDFISYKMRLYSGAKEMITKANNKSVIVGYDGKTKTVDENNMIVL